MSFAKRNALVRGVKGFEDGFSSVSVFHRAVDNRYKVTRHDYTSDSFREHLLKFCELLEVAFDKFLATEDDVRAYGKAAQFDGLE
jgi:hypothetical protein